MGSEEPGVTRSAAFDGGGLRIALLCYRGNPFSGGQGVYTRNLSHELAALGHTLEV